MVLVYKPQAQNATYFLNWLSQIIEFYSITYNKQVMIGNFNLTLNSKRMGEFMDLHSLINFIKTTACFKRTGSCIDLLLTNQKYTFETSLNDHHLLIYSMLKTYFQKLSRKDWLIETMLPSEK